VDARTDLFSFGAVLYEMATGQQAFSGATSAELRNAILRQNAAPARQLNPAVPAGLEAVIAKALEKDPELRYQSAAEIRTDLKRLKRDVDRVVAPGLSPAPADLKVGATETGAGPVPAQGRPQGSPPRGLWPAAAAVAGIILLGALGWWAWHILRPQPSVAPQASLLTLDESTLTQVTSSTGLDIYPALSPDGSSIAYSSDQNGSFEIYVKSLVLGGREFQLTSDGQENFEAAWSPDGKLIAYYSRKRGGIWLVPALGGAAHRLTEFGSHPAWSPDGSQIAFQSDPVGDLGQGAFDAMPPSTIWIVPALGGTPTQVTRPGAPPGGHGAPAWSPDGKRIAFVAISMGFAGTWSVLANGSEPQRLLGTGYQSYIYDPVFSPNGRAIYFSGWANNGWGLFRVAISPTGRALGEPERIKNTGQALYKHLNFSADGKSLAYSAVSIASNIWSVRYSLSRNEAEGPPEPLTRDTKFRKLCPVFSPDGKTIIYAVWEVGSEPELWIVGADGKSARPLTATLSAYSTPGWFPGGQRLAFCLHEGGSNFLASLDIESGRKERLREIGEDWEVLRLSPDGKQIAFDSGQGETINVWTAPVEGGPAKQLTFDKELMGFPSWSPDGKFLAFEMKRGEDSHIGIIPRGGGTPVQLTSDHGQSFGLCGWSPDGDKILFAGERTGIWNIWWVSRRDKTEKQITKYTKTNSYVRYPTWSPQGDQIAYEYAETTGNIYVTRLK
jgi:Tol biopolymer transport system component